MAIHDSSFLVYTITYIFAKIQINVDKYLFLISQKLVDKYLKNIKQKYNKYFHYYILDIIYKCISILIKNEPLIDIYIYLNILSYKC